MSETETGDVHTGISNSDYDRWYAVGQSIERAKNQQAGR